MHCYYERYKKQNRLVEKVEENRVSPASSSYATLSEQSKIFIIVMTGKQHMGRTHIQTLLFELTRTNFACKSSTMSIER